MMISQSIEVDPPIIQKPLYSKWRRAMPHETPSHATQVCSRILGFGYLQILLGLGLILMPPLGQIPHPGGAIPSVALVAVILGRNKLAGLQAALDEVMVPRLMQHVSAPGAA